MADTRTNTGLGADRLMNFARKSVEREWAGNQRKLGTRLERALLAEEVLRLLSIQDESVSDQRVRQLAIDGYLAVHNEFDNDI